MKTKQELKLRFENGDTPNQSDFWEWQDSYFHKEDKIPVETLDYDFTKKADLVDGKIPASQLPSYVDDVVEFDSFESLPNLGEKGKIYIITSNNTHFRWSGSEYIQLNSDKFLMTTNTNQDITGVKTYLNSSGNSNLHDNKLHIKGTNGSKAGISFWSDDVGQLIYFNTGFHFKNQFDSAYQSAKASAFIKDGSDNSYLLLGGGSHDDKNRFISGENRTGTTNISLDQFNSPLKSGFYNIHYPNVTGTAVDFALRTSYVGENNKGGFELLSGDYENGNLYHRNATGGGKGNWYKIWSEFNFSQAELDLWKNMPNHYWKMHDLGWYKALKNNGYVGFLTNDNQAQGILTGSILISNSYSDVNSIPLNGIYSKGNVKTSGQFIGNFFNSENLPGSQIINTDRSNLYIGNPQLPQLYFETGNSDLLHYREGHGHKIVWDGHNFNPDNYIPTSHPAYNINQTYLNGWLTYKGYGDVRLLRPENIEINKLQFGFTSWNNQNNESVWGDFLHFGGYNDGSGGNQNLIVFKKNGFGLRQWQGISQSSTPYQSYVDYWHSGNFNPSDYAQLNKAQIFTNTNTFSQSPIIPLGTSDNHAVNLLQLLDVAPPNHSNWVEKGAITNRRVIREMTWNNYGNGHTLFDISNGITPWGVSKSNTDAEYAWSPSYPTLVGGNGAGTYGVRVDSARNADNLGGKNANSYLTYTGADSDVNLNNKNLTHINNLGVKNGYVKNLFFEAPENSPASTYPYIGFYMWGDEWQVNSRNSSNTWVHNLLAINTVTKQANFSGLITSSGYGTSANWNQAVMWGNHADEGYATQPFVEETIDNLTIEITNPDYTLQQKNKFVTIIITDDFPDEKMSWKEFHPEQSITVINTGVRIVDLDLQGKTFDRIGERETIEYYVNKEYRLIKKGNYRETTILI